MYFFEKDHLKSKMILLGKRNVIFPDNTRKIIFQRDFLERPSLQNIWKNKIWLFVQCSLKQTQLLFAHFLYCLLLFLDDNVDEESE